MEAARTLLVVLWMKPSGTKMRSPTRCVHSQVRGVSMESSAGCRLWGVETLHLFSPDSRPFRAGPCVWFPFPLPSAPKIRLMLPRAVCFAKQKSCCRLQVTCANRSQSSGISAAIEVSPTGVNT